MLKSMVTSGAAPPTLHVISQVPVLACIWNPLLHDSQLSPLFTGQAAPVVPTPLLQLQVFAWHVLLIWTTAVAVEPEPEPEPAPAPEPAPEPVPAPFCREGWLSFLQIACMSLRGRPEDRVFQWAL